MERNSRLQYQIQMPACEYNVKLEQLNSLTNTLCRYCNQDEDNDPSPEFEEYLACEVCGDNGKCLAQKLPFYDIRLLTSESAAHRQCARDANTLSPDDGMFEFHSNSLGAISLIQSQMQRNGDAQHAFRTNFTCRRKRRSNL
jgi:histone acetyltransferase SAS3